MYASFCSIGLNLVLNASLMWVLGFMAFPLSTTLAAVLNVGVLYVLLPRKVGRVEFGPLAGYGGKLVLASAAGGAAAWLGNRIIAGELGTRFLATAASLAVCGLFGRAVFTEPRVFSGSRRRGTICAASSADEFDPVLCAAYNSLPSWPVGRRRVSPDERMCRRASAGRLCWPVTTLTFAVEPLVHPSAAAAPEPSAAPGAASGPPACA